ncbi:MAG TPA: flagellar biosynthetic protein FliR [Acidobacteriaceae bacterium]|nr:flagellar biosynthetic protein FliR [Acidobacteriaceae bacterium]
MLPASSLNNFAEELQGRLANTPDWPHFLAAMLLVMVRVSGLMVFAPVFSSAAIPARMKVAFVLAVSFLLAPVVSALPLAHADLGVIPVLGELGIGLLFGICLSLLNEILTFAGQTLGFQFSFSLVNLLDPNSTIETPLLAQMFGLLGVLVLIGAGLDRTILLAFIRSFRDAPVGSVVFDGHRGLPLVFALSGVFFAAVQLAAPVMAATLLVEVVTSVLGKLSPELPVMMIAVPAKTILGYVVLIGSLALWPRFIQSRFSFLLDAAEQLLRHAARAQ